jgi:hypothetical protein
LEKKLKLKGDIYFIDQGKKKIIKKKFKKFTHSKEKVVTRGKLKCSPLSHVRR